MAEERALQAIGRIERALARIEAAAGRPPDSQSADREELDRLRAAHGNLRGRVEGAIGQIDRLLDGGSAA